VSRWSVGGWVLYDLANTIFSMGIVSLYFSLWVREQVGASRADAVYGTITAVSMGIVFVAGPVLGALSDRAPRRLPFLLVSTVLCLALTATFARFGYGATIVAFVLANVAYQAGLQFYDALLPSVSTPENRGKVGGLGVGVGYVGSYVAIGLGLVLGAEDPALLFTAIAAAFALFATPCFLLVRERPAQRAANPRSVLRGVADTFRTLRAAPDFADLRRFLLGRVLYTDAINTVIAVMALYAVNIAVASGLSEADGQRHAQLILLAAVSFAVAGGFIWGRTVDRIGAKATLQLVLLCWIGILLSAAAIGLAGLPYQALYPVAAWAGFSMGGVWAADRPLMLRLTPPGRIGEFYGIYGMVGRFAAVVGPALWGVITSVTASAGLRPSAGQAIGVLGLMLFVVAGYLVLSKVSDEARAGAAESSR
jgi:UMF1 family MFS transporter